VAVTRERAELIARATACPTCREYTWRRVKVREAGPGEAAVGAAWAAELVCGVCAAHVHLALDDDGDLLYVG
jgi:hypothetical protein